MENSPYTNKPKDSFTTRLFTNPLIRRLSKVEDRASTEERAATYGGIGFKTTYFLLITVVGVLTFIAMPATWFESDMQTPSLYLIIALIFCFVFTLLTPILAWLIRPTIPVTGTLYSFSQGFLIAFSAKSFGGEYTNLIWTALVITLSIVFIMYILYSKRIIKVTAKFRSVVGTLFFTSLFVSLAMVIMSFIPLTQGLVVYILNNAAISIGGSVVMIIIASLFLLSDFDVIEKTVENRLPKKYEWIAAFGLVFTVIWLYLKVLSLLQRAESK